MARVTSPICRRCRREGDKLFLKGERCFTPKCAFVRRSYAPGAHGTNRTRLSGYGLQLREKQKAKATYGILEKQFRKYYEDSSSSNGKETMLGLIERRFDNIVYRLGFAASRREARQMVSHGRFFVNGKKVNIPSCRMKAGDVIELRNKEGAKEIEKTIKENQKRINPVSWLKMNIAELKGEVTSLPQKEDISEDINERLIIEHYSR